MNIYGNRRPVSTVLPAYGEERERRIEGKRETKRERDERETAAAAATAPLTAATTPVDGDNGGVLAVAAPLTAAAVRSVWVLGSVPDSSSVQS
ncbi:hypothetical protein Hdeb2414_s0025g00661251 [Helianthus debilis subsp. tardiflorus]